MNLDAFFPIRRLLVQITKAFLKIAPYFPANTLGIIGRIGISWLSA